MVRHISVFFLKKDATQGEKEFVEKSLRELEGQLTEAACYWVGKSCVAPPPAEDVGTPDFGDFVQVIEFETHEAATEYPMHPGHQMLKDKIASVVERVVAIEVEI